MLIKKIFLIFLLFQINSTLLALTLGANENLIEQKVAENIITKIFKLIGKELKVVPLPPARARDYNLSGSIDGEIARIDPYASDKPSLIRIEPSYYYLKSAAYCLFDSKIIVTKKEDLLKYYVAGIRGVAHSNDALADIPKVMYLKSANQLFEFLKRGRVDIVIDTEINGRHLLENPLYKHNLKLCGVFNHFDLYVYLNKNSSHIAGELSKKISELKKSGELEKIVHSSEVEILSREKFPE